MSVSDCDVCSCGLPVYNVADGSPHFSCPQWYKVFPCSGKVRNLRLPASGSGGHHWHDPSLKHKWNSKVQPKLIIIPHANHNNYYTMMMLLWNRFTKLLGPNDYIYSYNPCQPFTDEYCKLNVHVGHCKINIQCLFDWKFILIRHVKHWTLILHKNLT